MVRAAPFLEAGGFPEPFGVGGEEAVLACRLAALGRPVVYVEDVRIRHFPSPARDRTARRRREARNRVWWAWLCLPVPDAAAVSLRALARVARSPVLWPAVVDMVRGAGWVRRERSVVPRAVAAELRDLRTAG
jgi:hypothetical protein